MRSTDTKSTYRFSICRHHRTFGLQTQDRCNQRCIQDEFLSMTTDTQQSRSIQNRIPFETHATYKLAQISLVTLWSVLGHLEFTSKSLRSHAGTLEVNVFFTRRRRRLRAPMSDMARWQTSMATRNSIISYLLLLFVWLLLTWPIESELTDHV